MSAKKQARGQNRQKSVLLTLNTNERYEALPLMLKGTFVSLLNIQLEVIKRHFLNLTMPELFLLAYHLT